MSANPRTPFHYSSESGPAQALYFDSGDRQLFGWLHEPTASGSANLGLVICKPFGYEVICSHRSVRAFADAAAAMGIPALRFDYLGTGDSADLDPSADQVNAWSRDIVAAVHELQRKTGVEHVCLLGFRLGALLATLAAAQCNAVTSLALIAPILSGRRYLRDLRTTRLASGWLEPQRSEPVTVDAMEVSGFSLSAATVATLAKIDLGKLDAPTVADVLIIDSDMLPTAGAWAGILSAAQVRVAYLKLPGIVEMLMTDPQFAVIPQPMIEAMRDWLTRIQRGAPSRQQSAGRLLERESIAPSVELRLQDDASPLDAVTERPVFLGLEAVLFGIVTEPSHGDMRHRAVLLINVGAQHHIGSSRMYVSLARQWARHGYTVLRMDLAGLGDSATRPGRAHSEVFPPQALDDIRAGVEFLRSRYGTADITLGGLCSGAYHSLRAAIAGMPVNRVLMVNPMNFLWNEGLTADVVQLELDVARNVGFYRDRVLSPAIWKRILTGNLNVWRIFRIVMKRPFLHLESRLHDLARDLRVHMRRDLGWELKEIGARGVKMIFVFARGEPGLDVLRLQAGSSIKRLGDHCVIHVIDSADHIFSHLATRNILESILSYELFARNEPAPRTDASS